MFFLLEQKKTFFLRDNEIYKLPSLFICTLGEDFPSRGVPPQLAAADPEKAELIRQVLQLSDVQIAALPIEQQASIRDLKSQLGNVPR